MTDTSATLATELIERREAINRELSRNGVRFGIYKDGTYEDRLFPFDPIPRIIPSNEFDELERGLKQRVNALNAFLRDVYGEKRIVADGVIPAEYIYTSEGYLPQVNGVTPPGGVYAHIAGEDLVQDQDGHWWVLEDNLRVPSGASYPLFARDIERRLTPHLFRDLHLRDNRDYPRLLRKSMDFVSAEGLSVILTPGRYNSAFFEHAYLAEKTGAVLAFPEDLEVVENKLYLRDYAGNRHRVGVVYRRLSDEYLDPFVFNPDSVIGVPGLLNAYRAGNVAIVNAPGNGVADDKAIYYFVPKMIEYYLGEEPILHNAPTYLPIYDEDRQVILDRLDELVIKDVAEAGGYGVVFGSALDEEQRKELAERIVAEPRRFIAQEVIDFKDIDVVDPVTGQHSSRKCDLRAFVLTGKNTHVWYSGLTRYSSKPGEMIVNSSQGGGFKDTWVLADEQSDKAVRPFSILDDRSAPIHARSEALVTSSKADNLYWLGRYTERAYTTITQFLPFYDRVMDTDVEAFRPFAQALDLPVDFQDFDVFIDSFLYDKVNPNSVLSAVVAAFNNAVILRPELTSHLLQFVELAMNRVMKSADSPDNRDDIYTHRDVTDNLLAFWGGLENLAVDPTIKAFVFIGKYVERVGLYTRLGVSTADLLPPLRKLGTYASILAGLPVPRELSDGVTWLIDKLPGRGYGDVAEKMQQVYDQMGPYIVAEQINGLMDAAGAPIRPQSRVL
ncbi:hypothetical protein BIFGAL_03793 [Bifidobacterium gallicum DSM 20093 = LMG 11596]|uniref:UDP-N-acetylmuramate dehydrogenase n=1 Tax=Bifidobacterium gallicum DSM 20093 = LMG 11596 TaxID=561180 RepID=D1NVA8_9BIFI|nr:hypothetical protein BIFGAL_03793 [Bifidobacterium gallicum DSM 20093 = LMG 11596]KFI59702.1 UDP-N-acetylmuramate dehydrogenase [Bifidobacterium gallicum DSM 20093 = LMG 11596]